MAESTMEIGRTGNNMESGSTHQLLVKLKRENGVKAKELIG